MRYEYQCDDQGIYKYCKGGNQQRIANPMYIRNYYYNIDTKLYKAELSFSAFGETRSILVDRTAYLQRNNLLNLQGIGLDVTHSNVAMLVDYFREEEDRKSTNIENIHSTLGFGIYNNKRIYKLYQAIGIQSKYDGLYDLKPKGSYEAYRKMIKEEVLGNHALEFILSASMSAVLIGYLGETLDLETMILHLVGNSTTGKSSAMKLAISGYSNPSSHDNSLFNNYNGTSNALLKRLSGLSGVPFALDELSISDSINHTAFIYSLATGLDKDRLTKDSTLMAKSSWRTLVFSNGEKSLVSSASNAAGVKTRVIEVLNETWTTSSENAESIQETILQNYGHLGPMFAQHVMNYDEQSLHIRYNSVRNSLLETMNNNLISDTLTPRRCNKYAIILLGAELLQEVLNMEFQTEKITELLIKIERESIKLRNFKESVLSFIKDFVSIHFNQFNNTNNFNGSLGKIIRKNDCTEIQMNRTAFQNMLKEGNYEDINIVLKELKRGGHISSEKDRYTRSRKNDFGILEDVYVVVLKTEYYMPPPETPDNPGENLAQ